jgi:hypothetical protein
MALIVCGIDEAGYGPMLGPLCVAFVALRLPNADPAAGHPDLWELLGSGVCREPGDRLKRIAIGDSKKLKLPSDHKTKHPLVHLERGVLTFLRSTPAALAPATDAELLAHLGARLEPHPWYDGDPMPIPVGATPAEIAIASNSLAACLQATGIEVLDVRCTVVGEKAFNETLSVCGSKGETTLGAVTDHLRYAWGLPDRLGTADPVLAACDRLGGRTRYGIRLAKALQGAGVAAAEETPERSVYRVSERQKQGEVVFMPEAESAHLPVALASMTAKYVRELAMRRFNRYWCSRRPDLKPTAGYVQDARRWLEDAGPLLTEEERAGMIRRA